jgi:preprotein translocase subunit SecB
MIQLTTPPPGPSGTPGAIHLVRQYIKDLSFENPKAPFSLMMKDDAPLMPKVDIEVRVNDLGNQAYETELHVTVTGSHDNEPILLIQLNYAATFLMPSIPPDFIESFLMTDAPRQMFPFVRAIVMLVTQNSGFRPLHIEALDFSEVYRRAVQERTNAASASEAPTQA